MKPDQELLKIFEPNKVIEIPPWVQILDARIEKLHEWEEDENDTHTFHCIASISTHVIAVLDMLISYEDWSEERGESNDFWKEALKKIGWKVDLPFNQIPQSVGLHLYDFRRKIIMVMDILLPSDGVDFTTYSGSFEKPIDNWDILNISTRWFRISEPDENEKKMLIGIYRTLLLLAEPRQDFVECGTSPQQQFITSGSE